MTDYIKNTALAVSFLVSTVFIVYMMSYTYYKSSLTNNHLVLAEVTLEQDCELAKVSAILESEARVNTEVEYIYTLKKLHSNNVWARLASFTIEDIHQRGIIRANHIVPIENLQQGTYRILVSGTYQLPLNTVKFTPQIQSANIEIIECL